jgi:hypothetical protein
MMGNLYRSSKLRKNSYLDPNLQPYVDVFSSLTLENIAVRGEMGSEEIWHTIAGLAKREWGRPSIQINDRFVGWGD